MKKRPITTLYMLTSVDGKISTGKTDERDMDKDFSLIKGLKEGFHQYYEIEQTTDLWSFNTGRVQEKMGVNEKEFPQKTPVSYVLIDNFHLTEHGIRYFCAKAKTLVIVTQNPEHPAFYAKEENLHIFYQHTLKLAAVLEYLAEKEGCEKLTIQSGGRTNELFLREGLLDFVDIVVAPVLIGGRDTPTLIDGNSLRTEEDLRKLGILQLESCTPLENSYLRLRYKVVRNKMK